MATKEEEFRQRLGAVLKDLGEDGVKDGEAMFMLGSLAAKMADQGRVKSWSALKSGISAEAYKSLLGTMQTRGNDLMRDGHRKAAYALQALAVSLVARSQTDAKIQQGAKLLDQLINSAVAQYRETLN